MIPIRLWRRNAGLVAGIVAFPILWLYHRSQFDYSEGNAPTAMALALSGTFVAMVVAAAFGAWEGVRVTRFHRTVPNMRRNPVLMVAFVIFPTILSSAAALIAIVFLRLPELFSFEFSVWSMLVAGLAALTGAALFGLCLGMVIPSFLAAPLAAVMVYGLLILQTILFDDRYSVLASRFDECCEASEVIDSKAIASSGIFTVGMAGLATLLAGLIWIGMRSRFLYLLVPGIALCLGIAIWLPLRFDNTGATIARAADLRCATSDATGIEYCVWPEREQLLSELVISGDRAIQSWQQRTSLIAPSLVTEEHADSAPSNAIPIGHGPNASRDEMVYAIASGVAGEPDSCYLSFRGIHPFPYLMAWLLLSAGIAEDSNFLQPFGFPGPPGLPGPLEFARELGQASQSKQNDWLAQALAANSNCGQPISFELPEWAQRDQTISGSPNGVPCIFC